jgi:hypothetical protein
MYTYKTTVIPKLSHEASKDGLVTYREEFLPVYLTNNEKGAEDKTFNLSRKDARVGKEEMCTEFWWENLME